MCFCRICILTEFKCIISLTSASHIRKVKYCLAPPPLSLPPFCWTPMWNGDFSKINKFKELKPTRQGGPVGSIPSPYSGINRHNGLQY